MVPVRHIALLLELALAALLPTHGRATPATTGSLDVQDSLFAQSASQALARDFRSPDLSYLLLDARTGEILASNWERPEHAIPMGSIVKPFAALAYGAQHDGQFPRHTCRGTATGCWLPHGHGELDLTDGIAYSCNSYFRMLTANLSADDVSPVADRFGLELPSPDAAGPQLAGLGESWTTSPLHIARAYIQLAQQSRQPVVQQILNGMAESARRGTGSGVHGAFPADVLTKTGTAACTHARHSAGDGFAIVLSPADHPRLALLVRVHGVPGSYAARTAGQMLRCIED